MPPVTPIWQSKCLSFLRSFKKHEPIIEPHDKPLPAVCESYPGEGKRSASGPGPASESFRPDKTRTCSAPPCGQSPPEDVPAFRGSSPSRVCGRTILSFRRSRCFFFASVSFVSVTDNSEISLATAVSVVCSHAFSAGEGKSIKASIIVSIFRESASMLAFSSPIRSSYRRISSESAASMTLDQSSWSSQVRKATSKSA